MPKLKNIPAQISLDATELEKSWNKADKTHLCKNLELEFLLSGSLPYQLLNQQEHGTEINQDSDEDWSVITKNETERSLLETYKESIGNGIRASFPDSILEPSPRDARTTNILFYHFTKGKLDVTLGFPGVHSNFTFFICPKTGEIITDPSNPEHAEDIRLFIEEGLIKSYKLDSIIRQAYSKSYSLNILAYIIKSYKIPLRSLNKSFHIDTAKTLHTLFTSHPVLMEELKERLVEHYAKVNHKFTDEKDVSLFLDELKTKVANIVSPEPTAQEIKIEKLERKLENAQKTIKAYEDSAVDVESRVAPLENTVQKLQQKNNALAKENQTQKETIQKLEAKPLENKKTDQEKDVTTNEAPTLASYLVSYIQVFLDKFPSELSDNQVKNLEENAEKQWHKNYDEPIVENFLMLQCAAALYPVVTNEKAVTHYFEVFILITRAALAATSGDDVKLHKAIIQIDRMILKLDKESVHTVSAAFDRLEAIKFEITRTLLVTKILAPPQSDLIMRINRLHDFAFNNDLGQKKLLEALEGIDDLRTLLLSNIDLLKEMHFELIATDAITLTPTKLSFFKAYAEIIKRDEMQTHEIANALESYNQHPRAVTPHELKAILDHYAAHKKTMEMFNEWNCCVEEYFDRRAGASDTKTMSLATEAMKNIFSHLKKRFENATTQELITVHFMQFIIKLNKTKHKPPSPDDPLFTCLSPLLSKKMLNKLKMKNTDEISSCVEDLRVEILSHMRKTNFLMFDSTNLENEDTLLEAHNIIVDSYVRHAMAHNPSYITPYITTLCTLLPLFRGNTTKTIDQPLSDHEKEMIYKARLFFVGDVSQATTFKGLLSKKTDNLLSHIKIGSVLVGHPDELILTLSRAIRLIDKNLMQTYKNATDSQIERLGVKLNHLHEAYDNKEELKRNLNEIKNSFF